MLDGVVGGAHSAESAIKLTDGVHKGWRSEREMGALSCDFRLTLLVGEYGRKRRSAHILDKANLQNSCSILLL